MIGWLRRWWRSLRPGRVDRPYSPPFPPWPPPSDVPPRPPRDRGVACTSTYWTGMGKNVREWRCAVRGPHEVHRRGGKHWR